MAEKIASFMVELGFDEKVVKGVEKLERALDKIDDKIKRNSKNLTKEEQAATKLRIAEQKNVLGFEKEANKKRMAEMKLLQNEEKEKNKLSIAEQKLMFDKEKEANRQKTAMDNLAFKKQTQNKKDLMAQEKAAARQVEKDMLRRQTIQRKWDKRKSKRMEREVNRNIATNKFLLSSIVERGVEEGRITREEIINSLKKARSLKEQRVIQSKITADLRAQIRLEQKNLKIRRQSLAFRLKERAASSGTQLAGGAVSAFAAVGLGSSITRTGQEFQALENAMLAASSSAKEAESNLEFVRQTANRLGTDIIQSGKGFSQFLAAGQGKLEQSQIREIFLGVSEASTAMGLSLDDTTGTIRAITQIMSKGKVQAEELRGQLGERLSPSFRLMAKAVGVTTMELDKMLERGEVFAEDVLPNFARELRGFARQNDALDKALLSNRVAFGRLSNAVKEAGNELFTSGFSEGLTDLFNQLADTFRDLMPLARGLGMVLGSVFKGLAFVVRVLTIPLEAIGVLLEGITSLLGDFSSILLLTGPLAALTKMGKLVSALSIVFKGLRAVSLAFVAPLLLALGVVEEIINALKPADQRKQGLLTGPDGIGLTDAGQIFSAKNLFGDNAFTRFLSSPLESFFGNEKTPVNNNAMVQSLATSRLTPPKTVNTNNINVNIKTEIDGTPIRSMAKEVSREEIENATFID